MSLHLNNLLLKSARKTRRERKMEFEHVTGVNGDLIGKALRVALKANDLVGAEYYYEKAGDIVLISFRASFSVNDWIAPANHGSFGETKTKREQFPCLRSIGSDVDATVNEAFLSKFQDVLNTSGPSFQETVKEAAEQRKQIVFSGHSSGGATAILATVWYLQTCLNQRLTSPPPRCLTFGAPLVGDSIFKHALGRENWSQYFVNFVAMYDIVPLIMLAPKDSIYKTLPQILDHLDPKSTATTIQGSEHMIRDFYVTVMRYASCVASNIACQMMGNTNSLLGTISSFIELSSYRPVGTYVFCTKSERLVAVNNADAILQILYYSSQMSDGGEWPLIQYQSMKDHHNYVNKLGETLGTKLFCHLDQLPLSSDGEEDLNQNSIAAAVNDLGLSTRGRLCVRAAIEAESQRIENQKKTQKRQGEIEAKLAWVENMYKTKCETRKIGYFDSFKVSNEEDDFKANVARAELAGIFDEIVGLLKSHQLPDRFEGCSELIILATKYRRLIEPLDIANYYRHLKNEDTGPYMDKGRPTRYKYPQRWLEYEIWKSTGTNPESIFWATVNALNLGPPQDIKEKLKLAGSKCGSCFWTEVEELRGKPYQENLVRTRILEAMIPRWIHEGEVDNQIFLEGSTFYKWWNSLPDNHKKQSPVYRLMNGRNGNEITPI